MITIQEKLDEVEALIDDFRWARHNPGVPEFQTFQALKSIAGDLRGRLEGAPQVAEADLSRIITGIARNGTTSERLSNLGHQVLARWPVIKQALEELGSRDALLEAARAVLERLAPEPARTAVRETAAREEPALPAREA